MNFVEELEWRGMLQDSTPQVKEALAKGKCVGYLGVDPTSDALTIGNLASLMMLIHFQRHGHQPIALVGGATGMIGDPSGKKSERPLLTEEKLAHNQAGMTKALTGLLDFEATDNPAEVLNNYDWFKEMNTLDFMRNVGKHLSVNYMMSKDSVKSRLETGISFTEFSYQLIQGYDFYWLWKNKGCAIQLGGSDQWGNITAGLELIRRIGGGEANAITCPLITKADGSKFGKSDEGNIWLDASKTSPYKFYQFWMNASDEQAEEYIKKFTFLGKEEIDAMVIEHAEAPHQRLLQKRLAEEVTTFIHGKAALDKAILASKILFKSSRADLEQLGKEEFLEIFDGVPSFEVNVFASDQEVGMIDLLAETTSILSSKGEARRSLKENSISVNGEKVGVDSNVSVKDLLNDQFLLVQKGKRNKYLIIQQ